MYLVHLVSNLQNEGMELENIVGETIDPRSIADKWIHRLLLVYNLWIKCIFEFQWICLYHYYIMNAYDIFDFTGSK